MVIFHSYVKLPEGKSTISMGHGFQFANCEKKPEGMYRSKEGHYSRPENAAAPIRDRFSQTLLFSCHISGCEKT